MLKPKHAVEIGSEEMLSAEYDLFLSALGYETRSTEVSKKLTGTRAFQIALPFPETDLYAYRANKDYFKTNGFTFAQVEGGSILPFLSYFLRENARGGKPFRVCIDISSLTRQRMAEVLEAIAMQTKAQNIEVTFAYTVAEFSPPEESAESATVCGPVSAFFAGWPVEPEQPVAAIVGLGYELEKAVGAFEYLEPTKRILVSPISFDSRFDDAVSASNSSLLNERNAAEHYKYRVARPIECLGVLSALVRRFENDHRTVLLPFGPKLFAICSLILALAHHPNLGVWRISSSSASGSRDQLPSRNIVGMKILLQADS